MWGGLKLATLRNQWKNRHVYFLADIEMSVKEPMNRVVVGIFVGTGFILSHPDTEV